MPEGFATLLRWQTRRRRGASGAGSGPPIGVGMFIPFPPRPIQVTKHASSPPTALRQIARSASIGPRAADGGQERRREPLELGRADTVDLAVGIVSSGTVDNAVRVPAFWQSAPTAEMDQRTTPISPCGHHPGRVRGRPLTNFERSLCQNA